VRGLNDTRKWNDIRNKIEESVCVAICFQETKMSVVDISYVKKLMSQAI
jgi:hypothetical protein